MAGSGFVSKWLGKVMAKSLWIGSGGITLPTQGNVNITAAQLANLANGGLITAYTSAIAASVPNTGVANISASSAAYVLTLDAPSTVSSKLFAFLSVSSGLFIKSTAATFDGTNVVFKTTQAANVRLRGLSATRWLVESVFPGSTLASSALTFSATT